MNLSLPVNQIRQCPLVISKVTKWKWKMCLLRHCFDFGRVRHATWLIKFMPTRLGLKYTQVLMYQNNTQPHMTRHIKIPKIHFSTFWIHPTPVTALLWSGVGQTHLEVPREFLLGPKLKIHVKTIYCQHFVSYQEKVFVTHFLDFV